MIYLFEDRKGRMQQFLKDTIDDKAFKEVIFDCSADELETFIDEQFNDAKCIIFHRSYAFPQSGITSQSVKDAFIKRKVPFVSFSGGLENNQDGDYTGTANSGDMYNNLNSFIETYNKTGEINIPLLLFGPKYLLNSLLNLQSKIFKILFMKKKADILDAELVDNIIDEMRLGIKEKELSDDKDKLMNWLERDKDKKTITTQLLKSQIQKLIDKHT